MSPPERSTVYSYQRYAFSLQWKTSDLVGSAYWWGQCPALLAYKIGDAYKIGEAYEGLRLLYCPFASDEAKGFITDTLYDNDVKAIINICFYETVCTPLLI